MDKRFLLAASALAILAGCGGGGSGSIAGGGGGPIPAPEAAPVGSAKFTVDARTGEVKVEPISTSRAAFSGGALTFTSSLLLSEGTPERRVLRVTAKNNTQETIGADGQFRIVFSNFANSNTASTDLRTTVRTTTYFGNGVGSQVFGPLSSAQVQSPRHLAYNSASGKLIISATGFLLGHADSNGYSLLASLGLSPKAAAVGSGFTLAAEPFKLLLIGEGGTTTSLVGALSGSHVDGSFATARFTAIEDLAFIQSSSPTNFDLLAADGDKIRRIRINSGIPAGDVSTVLTAPGPIGGVDFKDGYIYYTTGNTVVIHKLGGGSSTIGSTLGSVDGAQASARFGFPQGIKWVDDKLIVADTQNNRIRQLELRTGFLPISPNAWWVAGLSGSATGGSVDGTGTMTHTSPEAIIQGNGQEIFVADRDTHRIRRIVPVSGRFVSGLGDSTPSPTEPASLINATDYVPSLPTRQPFILENQSIPAGSSVDCGDWQFNLPEGLKSFSFIVTVEADTLVPGLLPSVSNTGSGTKGSNLVSLRTFAGSSGPGNTDGSLATASFHNPIDICVAETGVIFVADHGNSSIKRISKEGKVTTILGPNSATSLVDGIGPASSAQIPTAIACSPDGSKVIFGQFNNVLRVLEYRGGDPAIVQSWKVSTIAGSTTSSGAVFNTNGALARFSWISGLAYIDDQTFAMADGDNNVILTIKKQGAGASASDYRVQLLAGSTTPGFVDGGTFAARFDSPQGITVSKSGYIFVCDTMNRRIRRVDFGGTVTTFAGSGVSGTQDSTAPLAAQFNRPIGVTAEPSGYLYVSDGNGKQVRRISPTGVVSTVAGTALTAGSADGTGNTGTFQNPESLAVGPGGDVFVIDTHRIRLLQRIITN